MNKAALRDMGYEVQNGQAVRIVADDSVDLAWQKVEAECRKVFEKAGCEVWSSSERRKQRVSAGFPDLTVFGPPGHPFHAYFECKAGRGALTEAQNRFRLHCLRTKTLHSYGGLRAAREFLKLLLTTTEAGAP